MNVQSQNTPTVFQMFCQTVLGNENTIRNELVHKLLSLLIEFCSLLTLR